MPFFDSIIRLAESNLTTWAIGFSDQISAGLGNIGLCKKTDYFDRSETARLKNLAGTVPGMIQLVY